MTWKKITQSFHPLDFDGNCLKFAMDKLHQIHDKDPEARMVHGVVTKPYFEEMGVSKFRGPYLHAWIEDGSGNAFDKAQFRRTEEYRSLLGIQNDVSYSHLEAIEQIAKTKSLAFWHMTDEKKKELGLSRLSEEEYREINK